MPNVVISGIAYSSIMISRAELFPHGTSDRFSAGKRHVRAEATSSILRCELSTASQHDIPTVIQPLTIATV
ncbi:hypothetical protein M8818_004961 [Zalaria obscura]|uniref:Uncharacterized protein n=1 Tax=Zalaria obscura TaxID=2024903 RepID=A0ACC3SAH3_9PEZI